MLADMSSLSIVLPLRREGRLYYLLLQKVLCLCFFKIVPSQDTSLCSQRTFSNAYSLSKLETSIL